VKASPARPARLQKADRTLAEFDRHRRVAQACKAADRSRSVLGFIDGTLFGFQAGRAATVGLGDHGAERVLMGLAMVRQPPKFHGSQRQGGKPVLAPKACLNSL
jgi:hypothetical protein